MSVSAGWSPPCSPPGPAALANTPDGLTASHCPFLGVDAVAGRDKVVTRLMSDERGPTCTRSRSIDSLEVFLLNHPERPSGLSLGCQVREASLCGSNRHLGLHQLNIDPTRGVKRISDP